ncbi:MAG: hypothetical protein LBU11_01065 [Zoogloeaceae bacterium]|jgi:hypothetical protein|nr:hypothetical protein [Zoogloeaceae bacterium]
MNTQWYWPGILAGVILMGVFSPASGEEEAARPHDSTFWAADIVEYVDLERPPMSGNFNRAEREMQYLIGTGEDARVTHHFCLLGYRLSNGKVAATVFWEEKGYLLTWLGSQYTDAEIDRDFERANSLARERGRLDLNHPFFIGEGEFARFRGMKPGFYFGADMGIGFHSLDDVQTEIAACQAHGKRYVIPPFAIQGLYDRPDVVARVPIQKLDMPYLAFSDMELELKYLITRDGDSSINNRFCVVSYQMETESHFEAAVFWQEKERMFFWDGDRPTYIWDGQYHPDGLVESPRFDLRSGEFSREYYFASEPEDVKKKVKETLENPPDVEKVKETLEDCRQHGSQIDIPPFEPYPAWLLNPPPWHPPGRAE